MKDDKIKVDLDGRIVTVTKEKYIVTKTKDLREFGYTDLSESEVESELENVLTDKGLNIIGMFIEKDIVKPKTEQK